MSSILQNMETQMPSEEVMYLTILSNSALTQQKLSLEQSLHA